MNENTIKKDFNKIKKEIYKTIHQEIIQDLKLIQNKAPRGITLAEFDNQKNDSVVSSFIKSVIHNTDNELTQIANKNNLPAFDSDELWLKIDIGRLSMLGINLNETFYLNIFYQNDKMDKQLRSVFYGGEVNDKDNKPIVISPISIFSKNNNIQIGENIQKIFEKKINEKVQEKLKMKIGDSK